MRKYFAVENTGVPPKNLQTNCILEQEYCDEIEVDRNIETLNEDIYKYIVAGIQ